MKPQHHGIMGVLNPKIEYFSLERNSDPIPFFFPRSEELQEEVDWEHTLSKNV